MIDPKNILPEDRIVHRQVAPVRQEKHLKASIRIRPNQKLFKCNLKTFEVDLVKIVKTIAEVNPDGSIKTRNRVNEDENCLYYGAYNSAQAAKHFTKVLNRFFKRENVPLTMMVVPKTDSSTAAGQLPIAPDPGSE